MKKIFKSILLGLGLCTFVSVSFASTQVPFLFSSKEDPLESINRPIFEFNQTADTVIITPVSTIYNTLIPSPIRTGANNFFDNIAMLSTTANDLLQGEFKYALNDAWRFIINSTFGLAGLIDVASEFGLQKHFNDLGVTLARWGYKDSTYIVVPFIGPATIRDGMGLIGDYYLFSPYPYIRSDSLIYAILTYRYFTIKAQLLDANRFMNEVALDPYIFARDAYYQYRNNKINESSADTSQYMYLKENEPQDEKPGAGYVAE